MPQELIGTKQAQQVLGLSPRYFWDLLQANPVPYVQRGKPGIPWRFDKRALLEWWDKYQAQATSPNAKKGLPARERKAEAEAEMAEIELARIKKELIRSDEVMIPIEAAATVLRQKFLAIPSRLAPLVIVEDQKGAKKLMDQAIREALDEFCASLDEEFVV